MNKNILYIFTLVIFLLFLTTSAFSADVKKIGENFVVENNGLIVKYDKNKCGLLSENVLQNIVDDANAGSFQWSLMAYPRFKEQVLYRECLRLKQVMRDYNENK